MDELIVSDPRDSFLIMLNERVGELETQLHSVNNKLDKLLEHFINVSLRCLMVVLKIPSSSSDELLFHPDKDEELAQLIYESVNSIFEIDKIYINRYSKTYGREYAEVTIYIIPKKTYNYFYIERQFVPDHFKEIRGCYITNISNCSKFLPTSLMHTQINSMNPMKCFEF